MVTFRPVFAVLFPSVMVVGAIPCALFGQEADREQVIAVVDRYHSALRAGDADEVLGLLAEDALILESGGLETREEYADHHLPGDMAFAAAIERERGPVQVRIQGDVAWAVSTNTAQGTVREREVDSRGAELMVLTRTDDGWRIAAIHWSSRNNRR